MKRLDNVPATVAGALTVHGSLPTEEARAGLRGLNFAAGPGLPNLGTVTAGETERGRRITRANDEYRKRNEELARLRPRPAASVNVAVIVRSRR